MEDFIMSKENFGRFIRYITERFIRTKLKRQFPDNIDSFHIDGREWENGSLKAEIYVKEEEYYMAEFCNELRDYLARNGLKIDFHLSSIRVPPIP